MKISRYSAMSPVERAYLAQMLGRPQYTEASLNGSKARIIHISPPKLKMKGPIIPDSRLGPAERFCLTAGNYVIIQRQS